VAVFDSHYTAGGCATQFARAGKYRFDVGLHYLGDEAFFQKTLAGVGAQPVGAPFCCVHTHICPHPCVQRACVTSCTAFGETRVKWYSP
jgi:hypothetical protein